MPGVVLQDVRDRGFIDDFVTAAKRAVRAGFDAIEIHDTHGYLAAAFMSGLAQNIVYLLA